MMLQELADVMAAVPMDGSRADYRDAIMQRNVLGKTTESTREKSLRHLRELYALDNRSSIFGLLRTLSNADGGSMSQLALQVAWARDPLLRATTGPVFDSAEGERVKTEALARAVATTFPEQYSELSRNTIARNCASSWTQSGHLAGKTQKIRQRIRPTVASVTMALFLGQISGYYGLSVFANPWCQLLDLNADGAKAMGMEAHRAGLLTLRAIGEVIELSFPLFAKFQEVQF